MANYVGAIDQGTTSSRFILFDQDRFDRVGRADRSIGRSTRSRAMWNMTRSRSGGTPRP